MDAKECDSHWSEVMELAEANGFILQAYGGTAMIATHEAQKSELGEAEYLKIQKTNGHCPRQFGFESCRIDAATGEVLGCRNCHLMKKGNEGK